MAMKRKKQESKAVNAASEIKERAVVPEYNQSEIDADIQDTINQAEGTFLQRNQISFDTAAGDKVIAGERTEVITTESIKKAVETLKKYKDAKIHFEQRVVENEQWWKMRHWQSLNDNTGNAIKPTSAWLFNSIMNKLADYSDNFPEPNIRARMADDVQEADRLKNAIPMILEANDYEATYMETSLAKIKNGTSITGVFWNSTKDDIDIKNIDVLSIFWEPGVKDIQASQNVFIVELVDNDLLKKMYPELDFSADDTIGMTKYLYEDNIDTSTKTAVIDWYYKKHGNLHYVKFANETIITASENEPEIYPDGFYEDGEYPFVVDTLFKMEGSIAGFGYLDVCKSPQEYIDRLDQAIITNALLRARPRYFKRNDSSINDDEFLDWTKPFVITSSGLGEDDIRKIEVPSIDGNVFSARDGKIQELKQTSGNSDVNTGTSASGVTAASAISQLIETGSKGSRHTIKGTYRAYRKIIYKVIERMRQFYTEPRYVRILGDDGTESFDTYDNSGLTAQKYESAVSGDVISRLPMFDIEVSAQKASPYNKMSQNELALQFYQYGFFNPNNTDMTLACLNMMDFDHKSDVIRQVQQNGTMMDMINMLQQENEKLKVLCDLYVPGSNLTGSQENTVSPTYAGDSGVQNVKADTQKALGDTVNSITKDDGTNSQAQKMRKAVADSTEVR